MPQGPTTIGLGANRWRLFALSPEQWRITGPNPDDPMRSAAVRPVDARVPGSVHQALLDAGLLPDWNHGLNALRCEWVENRQWFFETSLALPRPPEPGERIVLHCLGLDHKGWVFVNGVEAGTFDTAFTPHSFDLTDLLDTDAENTLVIGFDLPPRWLGHYGYTSRMTEWKPRFYFTWDWVSRIVQTGIWDAVRLEYRRSPHIERLDLRTDYDPATGRGTLSVSARFGMLPEGLSVRLTLTDPEGACTRAWSGSAEEFAAGVALDDLPVRPWWPNGMGDQPLYRLSVQLLDHEGTEQGRDDRCVGFRRIAWRACEDAPPEADPWICVVNDRPVFLQGVNWTPVRPNFADASDDLVRSRVALYREMGANTLRAWGGAGMERAAFFDACDEMGLLVWQEFPLCSSGVENTPPSDTASIAALRRIARSYIERRKHHACLLLWCGGNELMEKNATGGEAPCTPDHPMLAALAEVARELDPDRRFVHASASGPVFIPSEGTAGRGLHWDTHGPWRCEDLGDPPTSWVDHWKSDDSLFRSECGAPGASPAALIERYRGELSAMPPTEDNPLWNRTSWWLEWRTFTAETGRAPASLDEYVAWSQRRQEALLSAAARLTKARFPRCGGFLLWMGHDCFPCAVNTSVIDFEGAPKRAWHALREVFLTPPETLAREAEAEATARPVG